MQNKPLSFLLPVGALACAAVVVLGAVPVRAQQPPPEVEKATAAEQEVVLARAVVKPRENLEVAYTVVATAPKDSKLTGQKLRLRINESGLRDVKLDSGETVRRQGSGSRGVSINTGKFKTIGQLCTTVDGFLTQFLNAGATAVNKDFGKIGDARFGGELHFVGESADTLRFDYVPAEGDPIRFSRADVEQFAALLKK